MSQHAVRPWHKSAKAPCERISKQAEISRWVSLRRRNRLADANSQRKGMDQVSLTPTPGHTNPNTPSCALREDDSGQRAKRHPSTALSWHLERSGPRSRASVGANPGENPRGHSSALSHSTSRIPDIGELVPEQPRLVVESQLQAPDEPSMQTPPSRYNEQLLC